MFKGLHESLLQLQAWYLTSLQTAGPSKIALMMALESTIVPLPSEVIIPPAAHIAYTHQNPHLTIASIIIAGTIGSWIGAAIMYWVSRIAGRPLLLRYGKYVSISSAKIEGSERWVSHYGSMSVFISRFLPGIRHLIGIPAGMAKMDFKMYSLATVLGSGIWCSILCWLGIKMGQDEQLMKGEYRHIVAWLAAILLVLGGLYYFFVHRQMKKITPIS